MPFSERRGNLAKKKKRRRLKKKWRYRFSLLGIILLLWLILGPIKGHFLHKQESKEAKMQVSHQHFGKGIRRNRYPSRP